MASLAQRFPDNAPGDLYVDRTCIDCDACRRIAPWHRAESPAAMRAELERCIVWMRNQR